MLAVYGASIGPTALSHTECDPSLRLSCSYRDYTAKENLGEFLLWVGAIVSLVTFFVSGFAFFRWRESR